MEPPRKKTKLPKYAIITLPDDFDMPTISASLNRLGFPSVQFVHEASEFKERPVNFLKSLCPIPIQPKPVDSGSVSSSASFSDETVDIEDAKKVEKLETPAPRPIFKVTRPPGKSEMTVRQAVEARMRLVNPKSIIEPASKEPPPPPAAEKSSRHSISVIAEEQPDIVIDFASVSSPGHSGTRLDSSLNGNRFLMDRRSPNEFNNSQYVVCKLCDNSIMSSRVSNLTNHVRRHAAKKQFKCVHCIYQHNEQAKVRLHMTNNHKDSHSVPEDNLNEEMQLVWNNLMLKCFPEFRAAELRNQERSQEIPARIQNHTHQSQLRFANALQMRSQNKVVGHHTGGVRTNSIPQSLSMNTTSETLHNCIECGGAVAVPVGVPVSRGNNQYERHLATRHGNECVAYKCGDCGYVNAEQWKVRLHITIRHAQRAADVTVLPQTPGQHLYLFINKFFPSAKGVEVDEEEEELLNDIQGEEAPERAAAKIQAAVNGVPVEKAIKEEQPDEVVSVSVPICNALTELPKTEDEPKDALDLLQNGNESSEEMDLSGMTAITDIDRSGLSDDMMPCMLCGKILDFTNKSTLCSLMAHAKRHYHIKQFECSHCGYASSEAAHVRTHLHHKHGSNQKPIDHNGESMQAAWVLIMKKCFPELTERIDQFKFKSGKPYMPYEAHREREREHILVKSQHHIPTHLYGTRRNTELHK